MAEDEPLDTRATVDDNVINVSGCPGSGVWEKSENKKWEVVMGNNHRIPSRTRTRSEGSLDPCLSIHRFIHSFDIEEQQTSNYSVISDGSTMIRIDNETDTVNEADGENIITAVVQEEDPLEGSSGSQTRRVKTKSRRRSSTLSSPEQLPSENNSVQKQVKKRRRRRRRRKVIMQSRQFSSRREKWKNREVPLSVESSPGRDSPSPNALRRIVERGLLMRGMKIVIEDNDAPIVDDKSESIFVEQVENIN